jgi:ABC-type Mn2+/Zn2+ transport system permease subunit
MMALLVTPVSTALLVTRRVVRATALAALLAALSGVIGLYFSYYFGLAPGAAVVLVCTLFFLVAFVATHRRRVARG